MANERYVTKNAWIRQIGRPDAIDDVADQFERPVATGMESFWSHYEDTRWPRSSRGWRSMDRLHPRTVTGHAG